MIQKIEIQKEFDFQELQERLRKVKLRGFPEVEIYRDSNISIKSLSPEQIASTLFTPQPSVYTPELRKVSQIAKIFSERGIDISKLNGGLDYIATDENNQQTCWTIIPPVIEVVPITFHKGRGLDYSHLIGPELRRMMNDKDYRQNPQLKQLNESYEEGTHKVPEICDGSHRIEFAKQNGLEQSVLFIDSPAKGFPYYAVPQPYSLVHEEPERIEEKLDKIHILTSPGHKQLYRLFPSGGINNGNIRPTTQKVD